MNKKLTYKNFGEALDNLRIEKDLSYDRLGLSIGMTSSYLYSIINRRIASAPKDKIIEKISSFFHLEPEYFFEYRLRKHIENLEKNPQLLDKCEELLQKPKKDKSTE